MRTVEKKKQAEGGRQPDEQSQSSGARVVAAAPYYPLSRAEALSQRIGGKAIVLPTQPGEAGAPTSLFGLYEEIFNRLESAMSQTK